MAALRNDPTLLSCTERNLETHLVMRKMGEERLREEDRELRRRA